jgi:hypothetical protein
MQSDSIANLAAALAKAQPLIEGAIKDKTNPHFRSQYADLGNVIDAIRPAIAQHGLSFIQRCHDNEFGAKVETVILHESGEWYSAGTIAIPASKQDAQGFGSALTYARRYSLSAAFGVAPEDDDGNAATKKKAPRGSATEVMQDAYAAMNAEDKAWVDNLAMEVVSLHAEGGDSEFLSNHIRTALGENYDQEFKMALWSRLPSNVKTAISKVEKR